jgi:hypothetical protein
VVSLNFSVTYSFRPYHGPGVDSALSENEYQEHSLGVKAAGAWGWQSHHLHVLNVMEIWEPKPLETSGPVMGLLYLFTSMSGQTSPFLYLFCKWLLPTLIYFISQCKPAYSTSHLSNSDVSSLFPKVRLHWLLFQNVLIYLWHKTFNLIHGFAILSLASLVLQYSPPMTVSLTHFCELVTLEASAFPAFSLLPSPYHMHHACS